MHYTLIFFTAIDVMSGKPVESTATHPETSIAAEQGQKSGTLTFSKLHSKYLGYTCACIYNLRKCERMLSTFPFYKHIPA